MTFDVAERRARLGRRHHLASPGGDVAGVADDLVGFHASDPVTVYLSARARVADFDRTELEDALYARRTLVRMLGMRRTMFVTTPELAAVIDAAATKALGGPERARLIRMLEDQGVAADGAAWLADVARRTLEALIDLGEATAAELKARVPELEGRLHFGGDAKWAGQIGLSTRVLFLLATEGRIIRGRPKGTWKSSLYRWVPTSQWLGRDLEHHTEAEAAVELLRRWLWSYGPGTFTDLKWFTGWTVAKTRAALARLDVVTVDLDGTDGYLLADDTDPVDVPNPWVALLPGLDPSVMGWKERRWLLGDHERLLFDRNGNAGATAWCDGRIVGAWAQRPDGEIVIHLTEDVGADQRDLLDRHAASLAEWLGEERIKPRFRTDLDKKLTT